MQQSFADWHKSALADCAAGNGGTPSWLLNVETARSIYASMAPSPVEQRKDAEVARLQAEVASLRREIAAVAAKRSKDARAANANFAQLNKLADTLFGASKGDDCVVGNVLDRIERLEQHASTVNLPSQADLAQVGRHGPQLYDAGVWDAERWFKSGDVVTCTNAAWVARIDCRGLRPGTADAWRLLNKSDQGHLKRIVREELARQTKGPTVR